MTKSTHDDDVCIQWLRERWEGALNTRAERKRSMGEIQIEHKYLDFCHHRDLNTLHALFLVLVVPHVS